MLLNLADDKSTLVQVMAWCRQATSHYLSQCWPRSVSPYGVTRPQWVINHWLSDRIRNYIPVKLWDVITHPWLNLLRLRQNGRHFSDDILKYIFLNENVWISIKISLKFVPKVPINNYPALVQIMAWCWPGDKPLSEPMMVRLPTHICITRPQRVNFEPLFKLGHGWAIT